MRADIGDDCSIEAAASEGYEHDDAMPASTLNRSPVRKRLVTYSDVDEYSATGQGAFVREGMIAESRMCWLESSSSKRTEKRGGIK